MRVSSVFTKTLYDQRRSFIGWALGVGALVIVMAAMWPSVRSMPGLDKFVRNYPEALRKLFNLKTFKTGSGYLNTELFSLMIPALFLVFGIGHGARLIAGEEDERTLDVLLSTGCSRRRVLLEKGAGLVVVVLGLGLVLFVVTALTVDDPRHGDSGGRHRSRRDRDLGPRCGIRSGRAGGECFVGPARRGDRDRRGSGAHGLRALRLGSTRRVG